MADLKCFRKMNNLTQTQLGDYLGIKKSFISAIETGRAQLPDDKFDKLLQNREGWDTSALVAGDYIEQNGNDNIGKISNNNTACEDLLKALNRSIESNAKAQEQIDRLLTIIEKMQKI